MKKGLTELVFIIDRSGSMLGLENDTIGGFNSMLEEQRAVEGEAVVTTIFFNERSSVYHDRIDIRGVAPLTREDYIPGGSTALLDAIGIAIHNVKKAQRRTKEEYRAEKVLFVIITDGEENSSRHYTFDMVKERIERLKRERGWEFVFFGANMDAIAEAGKIGIDPGHAYNYSATSAGTQAAYSAMSAVSTSYRTGGGMGMQSASDPANNDEGHEESLVDALARQAGITPHDISDEEKEETLREFYEIFAPVNMERDLKAIREHWAPAAVIVDACRLREDDIDRQGKEEAPREIHEETALLQGELSAITFQVGRYLVRDARRVYNKNETGILWHLFDETPASDADVELVRNHSDELLHLLPSLEEPSQSDWRKRLRVVEEISARRLDDPGSTYTTICWADTSQLYHSPSPSWTEIGPIYAMKEDESDPDESASLLVCRTYCGDTSTTDTWHRLDPSGEVTCFSVDTIPSWMGL